MLSLKQRKMYHKTDKSHKITSNFNRNILVKTIKNTDFNSGEQLKKAVKTLKIQFFVCLYTCNLLYFKGFSGSV